MSHIFSCYFTLALIAHAFRASASTTPQPVVCTSSNEYLGYDGQWSPIQIRVGTEEQWLWVFPTTLSQETWLVGPASCDGTITCANARGGLFYSNQSSTFQDMGFYELGSNAKLEDSQSGYYGLDTIAINDDAGQIDQIIALVNTSRLWVGELGLGVQQTRINGSENRLPFLSSLVQNDSAIPSHSYGYTAGASYRLKGVPASLTLGGVDANRFTPNNVSLTLSSGYAPTFAINSIAVSSSAEEFPLNWNANPTTLLSESEATSFVIDSSTPYLWLPAAICDNFAAALNLTYNETLELYVFANGSSSPETLQNWNLTFTFQIANLPGSDNSTDLTLPYSAFNLELSYGFPNFDGQFGSPPLPYFPLRRAATDSQLIIGRAFLQETYLMVDYERNMFTLSQAVITEEAVNNVNLLAISRPSDTIFPGPASDESSSLSTGAKAGIGVGVGLGVVVVATIWLVRRKRKAKRGQSIPVEKTKWRIWSGNFSKSPGSNTTVSELLGDKQHPTEIPADSTTSRFELPGSAPIEMPAAEVSPTFFQSPASRSDAAQRNDPRDPAELEQRQGQAKAGEAIAAGSERSASPVPPYSPAEMNQRLSNSISPYTPRHSQGFGTVSSGEQGISPVGHSSGNGSERNSNSVPSPVSPDATFTRGLGHNMQPSEPGSNESQTSRGYGQHLTPQVPGRTPPRSPSRGSRFVEEGLDGDRDGHTSSSRSARFSWEE